MTGRPSGAGIRRPVQPEPSLIRLSSTSQLALALLVVVATGAPAQPAPPPSGALSLAEAFAVQARQHEAIKAADALVRQRAEERAAARSLYYPRVDAHLRATRIDSPIEIDLDPIRQAILALHQQVPASMVPPFITTVQEASFWKADIRATWPIFTGGRVPAVNAAAAARVDEAVAERSQTRAGLRVELVRRYFSLRLSGEVARVRGDVAEGLRRHVFNAARLEEEGLVARVERLAAEVALAEAERMRRRASDDESLARIALAGTLATDVAPEPLTPLFVQHELDPVEVFIDAARRSHPALARLETQVRLAGEAARAEDGRKWPEVYAFGLRELHEGALTILEPAWAVGVGANWSLFDGGERARRTAAARAQQARVVALDAQMRRDLATLVESKYREVRKARDLFDTLQAAITLADENLRVRSRAFEEGVATSLEVVDARLALARAELERLLAAYDFDVALAELLDASGQSDRYEEFRGRAGRQDVLR